MFFYRIIIVGKKHRQQQFVDGTMSKTGVNEIVIRMLQKSRESKEKYYYYPKQK